MQNNSGLHSDSWNLWAWVIPRRVWGGTGPCPWLRCKDNCHWTFKTWWWSGKMDHVWKLPTQDSSTIRTRVICVCRLVASSRWDFYATGVLECDVRWCVCHLLAVWSMLQVPGGDQHEQSAQAAPAFSHHHHPSYSRQERWLSAQNSPQYSVTYCWGAVRIQTVHNVLCLVRHHYCAVLSSYLNASWSTLSMLHEVIGKQWNALALFLDLNFTHSLSQIVFRVNRFKKRIWTPHPHKEQIKTQFCWVWMLIMIWHQHLCKCDCSFLDE